MAIQEVIIELVQLGLPFSLNFQYKLLAHHYYLIFLYNVFQKSLENFLKCAYINKNVSTNKKYKLYSMHFNVVAL